MFTNNGKQYLLNLIFGKVNDHGSINSYVDPIVYQNVQPSFIRMSNYDIFSTMQRFPSQSCTTVATISSGIGNHYGVIFGNGTGSPSAEDSQIFSSPLTSIVASNTTVSTSVEYDSELNKTYYRGIYTITNNTTNDITVSEIGLLATVVYTEGKEYYQTCASLIEHSVLDTPVTIPVNSVGQITYTICMDDPIFN
jgi:hypothetical protein